MDEALPYQPYNCMPMIAPGALLLLRFVSAGADPHPFHTHGNNFITIARDAFLLSTDGTAADLAESNFTTSVTPGGTEDAIFTWTGAGMGWDI
jgi:FtsP/CotA-like multicopper oxidase with cupredoxin domain